MPSVGRLFSKFFLNDRSAFLIIVVAVTLLIAFQIKHQKKLEEIKANYQRIETLKSQVLAESIADKWKQIYQGLRTIARLPGVRKIDRYGTKLDANAKSSIQEIYNNLASNVDMSEVYIVPRDLEPDQLDLNTGKLQEPIVTFDKLIVGKSLNVSQGLPSESNKEDELEIFEYRLMKSQIKMLSERYANEKGTDYFNYPLITGAEVITCDNRFYSKTVRNDRDRTGLVISVPFYDQSGKFKGLVSGILLNRIIQAMIPRAGYRVVNRGSRVEIGDFDANSPIHMTTPIKVDDLAGAWSLETNPALSEYWDLQEVKKERELLILQMTVVVILALSILVNRAQQKRKELWIRNKNELLEQELKSRVDEALAVREKLVSSSKMIELGMMSSGVAHEINNPLAIIDASAARLEGHVSTFTDPVTQESLRKIHDRISRAVNRISDIVKGLKTFSRDGAKDPLVPIELGSVVQDSLILCQEKLKNDKIELRVKLPPEPIYVLGRSSQISQVIINLLSNAVDAIETSPAKWIQIEIMKDQNSSAKIRVSDSGPGVPPEIEDKILQPFFTTKPVGKGTGLGLSITLGIVQDHDGTLHIDRSTDVTTFVVTLPISENDSVK